MSSAWRAHSDDVHIFLPVAGTAVPLTSGSVRRKQDQAFAGRYNQERPAPTVHPEIQDAPRTATCGLSLAWDQDSLE